MSKGVAAIGSVWLTLALAYVSAGQTQTLDLPARPANALRGSEFAKSIASLERPDREEKIYFQVALGNVPDFLRKLAPIHTQSVTNDRTNSAVYYVTPDYLAIGSDADYFLVPLSPITAQRVADLAHCSLPTKKMVDDIYAAAAVKLTPSPIPPSPAMVTMPIFVEHDATVHGQRKEELEKHPLGALVAGHKKDVVISGKLPSTGGKVAIYGWHKPDGKPIQPLYTGHADYYADYSHGIRLVQTKLTVNGHSRTITEVLADPELSILLSDEGPITNPKYPADFVARKPNASIAKANASIPTIQLADFRPAGVDEQTISYVIFPEVKVHINAPTNLIRGKKLRLIFYALPNGNSTEQTIGRKLNPGDDWHFDIQQIGAQTRFLRNTLPNENLVVVYLEAEKKAWPNWRKEHTDLAGLIPQIVDSVKTIFKDYDVRITLSGHSGGGSFIFGYLNAKDRIPDDIERIAFLDSNYAYDEKQGHKTKLLQWLEASNEHFLMVLAYNDAVALLDGKHFVSAEGGTWGRSHAMLKDFAELNFSSTTNGPLETLAALNGRVKFVLLENPEQKIYHTVQVERNGFIQSLLSGTLLEGKGYEYFGQRAYTNWVR
jgi:hypothetical protein